MTKMKLDFLPKIATDRALAKIERAVARNHPIPKGLTVEEKNLLASEFQFICPAEGKTAAQSVSNPKTADDKEFVEATAEAQQPKIKEGSLVEVTKGGKKFKSRVVETDGKTAVVIIDKGRFRYPLENCALIPEKAPAEEPAEEEAPAEETPAEEPAEEEAPAKVHAKAAEAHKTAATTGTTKAKKASGAVQWLRDQFPNKSARVTRKFICDEMVKKFGCDSWTPMTYICAGKNPAQVNFLGFTLVEEKTKEGVKTLRKA